MPNAAINSDIIIGDGVIINTCDIVQHDCVIHDFACICPNTALVVGVHVYKRSWIGIDSAVIQLIKIGEYVTAGAGWEIMRNIPRFIANPAKSVKQQYSLNICLTQNYHLDRSSQKKSQVRP